MAALREGLLANHPAILPCFCCETSRERWVALGYSGAVADRGGACSCLSEGEEKHPCGLQPGLSSRLIGLDGSANWGWSTIGSC